MEIIHFGPPPLYMKPPSLALAYKADPTRVLLALRPSNDMLFRDAQWLGNPLYRLLLAAPWCLGL